MKVSIGRYPKDSKTKRKISIKIDKWDSWSADATIGMIVVPIIKQLKKKKQGIPAHFLDKEYTNLVSSKEYWEEKKGGPLHKREKELFKLAEKRWDAVLNEIIWSFDQLHNCWEDKYYHKRKKDETVESKTDNNLAYRFSFDEDGARSHESRIEAGLHLFAKYARNLWE